MVELGRVHRRARLCRHGAGIVVRNYLSHTGYHLDAACPICRRGASDRRILMDLNYRDLPHGEQAVRVSVEDANKTYDPDELPPIEPMPAARKAALP